MPTIKLSEEWTYRTPLVTVTYPAGSHTVDDAIREAAISAGAVKEKANGDRDSKAGAADDTGEAES